MDGGRKMIVKKLFLVPDIVCLAFVFSILGFTL